MSEKKKKPGSVQDFTEAVEQFLKPSSFSSTIEERITTLETLYRILVNIFESPTQEKYRILNKHSNIYTTKILTSHRDHQELAENLLICCGFTHDVSRGQLSSPRSLEKTAAASSGVSQHLVLDRQVSQTLLKRYIDILFYYIHRGPIAQARQESPSAITSSSSSSKRSLSSASRKQKEEDMLKSFREHQGQKYKSQSAGSFSLVKHEEKQNKMPGYSKCLCPFFPRWLSKFK